MIDDALADPEAWVAYAADHIGEFAEREGNAYPGPELALPPAATAALESVFATQARRALGGRRTHRCTARFAIATRPPQDLSPRQWLCHVDRLDLKPGEGIAASVLYLFRDPALGGTAFFRPRQPIARIAELVQASGRLAPAEFTARYGIAPGYPTASNAWFERLAAVPARFNRLIFYPGNVFHAGDIAAPARLVADPRAGRLTLNGFFVFRRSLA